MIKAKKSRNEIAGAFWKAASAANAATAFKPRPGGAGERMRLLKNKTEEGPDGISGVVPAPPRPSEQPTPEETPMETPMTEENKQLGQPKPAEPPSKSANRMSLVPEVKITLPTSRPTSIHGPPQEVQKPAEPEKKEPRRSINAGNDMKYLQSLGVNPAILDERSEEFAQWLDYFGWIPGDQMRARNVEEMRADLERELNKAQAGGWLARFREEDERVDAIKAGLDVAMAECEELDNLLTLYSVELSVCVLAGFRNSLLTRNRHSQRTLPTLKPKVKVSKCKLQTRSYSRKNSSPCLRLALSRQTSWKYLDRRLWMISAACKT
jgi:hypothetical protein